MSLHDEVIAVLDSCPPEQGVIVTKGDRTLAFREPDLTAPHPSAVMVILDSPELPPVVRRRPGDTCHL